MFSLLGYLYKRRQEEFGKKLRDMINPEIVYVTDLVSCTHKREMRFRYPLLSFRFEPSLVMGELVHAGIESILGSEEGWRAEVEVSRSYEIDGTKVTVKGRADLVKEGEDGSVELVVEIKTARDLPEGRPHQHHVEQLQAYMELLGAERGLLVYITPERLLEFPMERSGFSIESRLREVLSNAARPRYEWECRYCPFRRLCPYAGERR